MGKTDGLEFILVSNQAYKRISDYKKSSLCLQRTQSMPYMIIFFALLSTFVSNVAFADEYVCKKGQIGLGGDQWMRNDQPIAAAVDCKAYCEATKDCTGFDLAVGSSAINACRLTKQSNGTRPDANSSRSVCTKSASAAGAKSTFQ